ncbi:MULTISPECIES: LysR family transcriptional regulator [Gammaproteobacteria]|uniref:DNA-binding transcriptional LysR family regulator n=1 Tax=Gallaecimonas pentaromativorans TaxID=584787 RepID=A0A3N1PMQ1_9GAMM|nr:LysR family transcriptional regulator [Gallaecimonas pentaromativorans]MED5526467.1 LysR family transcriptional regulator [Pseudomonadota bacterium]ROQ25796.1 DNA-binding transcriptional LysR family regulator [Gallaecimonas pentaromativorans]
MARENLNDLVAFVTVARERSFTRAAAQLGISQSALSHSMRNLEARLEVRLLTRTTRSVSLTDLGQKFLDDLGPDLDAIQDKIQSIKDLSDKPSGTIRISTSDMAVYGLLWPKLKSFLKEYPDIRLELIDDYALVDIVAKGFDAGTRLGEHLSDGMISVRIGPDVRFALVASPDYLAQHPAPAHPHDVMGHSCIGLRLPTHGNLYVWEFEKDGKALNVKADCQLVFSRTEQQIMAAREGQGLAHVPRDMAQPYLDSGELVSLLDDWFPLWDGFYLYYPSRRQPSKAFELLLNRLRHHQP